LESALQTTAQHFQLALQSAQLGIATSCSSGVPLMEMKRDEKASMFFWDRPWALLAAIQLEVEIGKASAQILSCKQLPQQQPLEVSSLKESWLLRSTI
jgi:hypothetical protein